MTKGNTTRVFIAPGDSYHAAIDMFERAGFEVVKSYEGVDLICFLGGTDVDPAVYGEERGPYTQSPDKQRDAIEVALYNKHIGIPKVGICRGGQLLNVLNGGKMIQHLGKCVSGDVDNVHENLKKPWPIMTLRVDHHQGIKATASENCVAFFPMPDGGPVPDYAVWYSETQSLGFQPHPEWGHKGTEDYFFELIERYFGFKRVT